MDVLDAFAVTMPCMACSARYELTLKQVLLSHQMLNDGCPVSDERECPPLFWARIVDETIVRQLQSVWSQLEECVHKAGGELKLLAEQSARSRAGIGSE